MALRRRYMIRVDGRLMVKDEEHGDISAEYENGPPPGGPFARNLAELYVDEDKHIITLRTNGGTPIECGSACTELLRQYTADLVLTEGRRAF